MKISDLLGTGRIKEILSAIKKVYKVKSSRELSEQIKLDVLLTSLQLSASEFDNIIADNSPVYRTVKGHAFEIVFEYLVKSAGVEVIDVGGDGNIDLLVNNHKLQLKTPYSAGTTGDIVQYKTHKTHGAKSERESMDYYHHVDDFADFLVGLISYEPLNIIFLNKAELPRHPKSKRHILSPFIINWKNHQGLNNFKRIGIDKIELNSSLYFPEDIKKELLPKSAALLNLKTNIILDTILFESNFRIWDMALRGWAREVAISNLLKEYKIKTIKPTIVRNSRGDKSDFALRKKTKEYDFFQVKGVSTNNCLFNGKKSIIATETQLTRGRVNDHPTQSRLYLTTDFDFLILCVDPALVKMYDKELEIDKGLYWKYYCIPVKELEVHHVFKNRLKSLQSFNILEIEKYKVSMNVFKKYVCE
jgi:hypothetical protein